MSQADHPLISIEDQIKCIDRKIKECTWYNNKGWEKDLVILKEIKVTLTEIIK